MVRFVCELGRRVIKDERDDSRRLGVTGTINAELDGQPIVLSGEGTELKIEVNSSDLLLRKLNPRWSQRKRAMRMLAQGLQQKGMTAKVMNRGKPVAVLGQDAKTGLLSRFLGVPHLELKFSWATLKLLIF